MGRKLIFKMNGMKYIYSIFFILTVILVSCDQDNIGTIYEPEAPYVAFTSSVVPGNELTSENNYSVSVQIVRSNASAPTTADVVLEMNDDIDGVFELESSTVTFEDGKNVAYAKIVPAIDPSLMDISKTYEFNLTLSGENVSEFYSETTYKASFKLTFSSIGTGTFHSEIFGDQWTVEVEKAAEADVYKILDCYVEGYDIIFSVDAEDNIHYSTQPTGYEADGMLFITMPDSEYPYYYFEPYKDGNDFYLVPRMYDSGNDYDHWFEYLVLDN